MGTFPSGRRAVALQGRTNSFFSYRARRLARKLLAGVLIELLLVTIVTPAQAAVFTPGEFAVSPTGAATYTIPIQVPPGTAGMAPKLSLVYNSQAGNGLLGVGWSLSGLSAIARCPQTVAQDGVKGGVNYDANDRFCLDGQRLIAINGAYGADSTEYRTERESFAKIVSYGTAGNGPAWFKVWTKSGQIMEFGNTADSRIEAQGKTTVRVWALNKVSDTKGNYFTVTYTEDNLNGQYYPVRIDYTGNAAAVLTPSVSVQFVYQTRPDAAPLYEAGSLIKSTVRLTNVQTYIGTALVKDYRLTYSQGSATQRSRLTVVTECAGDGTCLPAMTMVWTDSTTAAFNLQGLGTGGGTGYWPGYTTASSQAFQFTGDFNGDGKTDFMYWDGAYGGWQVLLSAGAGFAPVQSWGTGGGTGYWPSWTMTSSQAFHFIGDFNGDGKTDFMYWDGAYGGWQLLSGNFLFPDLLATVTNGLGPVISLTYKALTDGSVYTKDSTAVYPSLDLQVPIYVVSSYTASDGVGGNLQTSYTYTGAKADLSGRGFLGFRQTQVTNTATGLKAQSTFRQDWPYVGLPAQVKRMKSDGSVLSQVDTTYGCTDFVSVSGCTVGTGKRYFPYLAQSVEAGFDLNGAVLPTVTTTNQFDNYGNATQITVSTSDGYSKSTVNTFTNDTLNWFLGRLTRATVTSTTP